MIQVVIADDTEMILGAMSAAIESRPDMKVVGLARDGFQAVELATELVPDVVVMDVQMPNMGGLEAAERIRQALPSVGVLFVSGYVDLAEASHAAGGDGFLAKPCSPAELCTEVARIAARYQRRVG